MTLRTEFMAALSRLIARLAWWRRPAAAPHADTQPLQGPQ